MQIKFASPHGAIDYTIIFFAKIAKSNYQVPWDMFTRKCTQWGVKKEFAEKFGDGVLRGISALICMAGSA